MCKKPLAVEIGNEAKGVNETELVCCSPPYSQVLEEFDYGTIASVNEEEPPTTHSLIINLRTRVSWLAGNVPLSNVLP